MNTLITFKDTWALWAVLFGSAAFGLWMERSAWGARLPLPGAAFTMVITILLSNFGVIPSAAPVYRTVWFYLVPLAIPLLLFNADVRRLPRDSGFTLVAFAVGAIGTIVGAVVAFYLVPLGKDAWRFAAAFSAAYIGGPMNYTATAQALGLRAPNLFAGRAAIDFMIVVYMLILFALPMLLNLRRGLNESFSDHVDSGAGTAIHVPSMAFALALSIAICGVGFFLEARFGWRGFAILLIAAMAVGLAAALPRQMAALQGANEMGMLLMLVFFATLGASANIGVVFKNRPALLLFAAIMLAVHLAVLLAARRHVGRLIGISLSLPQIIIGSNAGVGDTTTAAAMAATRRWYQFVPAAILCGALGYASAAFIGNTVGKMLR